MTTAVKAGWMQTFTGKAFYPLEPVLEDIDIVDIAHGLSMLCRYNGATSRFYSVAEHCVLMSTAVAPEHALWALLHDATEAYIGDMISPLKRLFPDFRRMEDDLMCAIAMRFKLPSFDAPAEVKLADLRILLDERAALLAEPPQPWPDSIESMAPLGVYISGWRPARAERLYLERFAELTA